MATVRARRSWSSRSDSWAASTDLIIAVLTAWGIKLMSLGEDITIVAIDRVTEDESGEAASQDY